MKIVKKILLVVLILAAIPFISALFMKKDYAVEREITVSRTVSEVFEYLKYFKNHQKFSTWTNKDPKSIITFKGEDGKIGATSTWDGNDEVGKGEQELKKIDPLKRIDVELRFIKPFEGVANAYFTTEAIDSTSTKVIWGINGRDEYPLNFMQVFINYDTMMGTEFEAGLKNLKTVLETQK
ncbi:SRPBCC family protein [Flavobacterium sp.]|uniref:SRPBCC family protein n=1 Tax=Flavobacterium sp. TaxID=239 RepID=UPI00286EAF18|nr:SRPBCC family protein [Flavobacterium sp.]